MPAVCQDHQILAFWVRFHAVKRYVNLMNLVFCTGPEIGKNIGKN